MMQVLGFTGYRGRKEDSQLSPLQQDEQDEQLFQLMDYIQNLFSCYETRGKCLERTALRLPASDLFDYRFQYVQERQQRVKGFCSTKLATRDSTKACRILT